MPHHTLCGCLRDACICAYTSLVRPLPRYATKPRAGFSTPMADACDLWGGLSSAEPRNASWP